MSKSKVLLFGVLFLLIFQLFAPNIGLLAESDHAHGDLNAKVEVKTLDYDTDSINWLVTIETSGESENVANTMISFSDGQSHGSIKQTKDVKVQKYSDGYSIESPAGNHTYALELSTKITDETQTIFSLEAKTDYDGKSDQSSSQALVENTPSEAEEMETEKADEMEKTEQNESMQEEMKEEAEKQSKAETEKSSKAETEKQNKEEEKRNEEKQVAESSYDAVLAKLKSKPLEEFTEKEMKKLLEGLSEEELQRLQEEFEVAGEVGVVDPNFKPFATNKQGRFSLMSSQPEWPAPGSVKLNGKDATPTGKYGEWEIELSVEAKDIDTTKSTDIVIVFDRSGSMQGNRLTQAKNAAKQFVNELLTEGSQTRIAVVTFSDKYQTLTGGFQGVGGKQPLLNAINGISASGGTNIQGGLREANNLLANQSSAQEKIIVLLSDGEPTYSYKANNATAHSWSFGSYNFRLTNFTNTQLGSGSSYNLSAPTCILGFCWGGEQYKVNGFDVKTNGSATISEAYQIMNNGINMYSIGLDVGNNSNATNVLRNSQNKGYYQAGQADLGKIFDEIAGELKYAATNAIVTDPLGEMFNLVKGKYSGADFTASHGTVSWDENSETFSWNIGDIVEGAKPTLKYTVTIDWKHPDLKGQIDYPMNKETPLTYRDMNGNNATKHFKIPKGQIDQGKIKRVGYRVNGDGEPVDADGNVVSIEEAHTFYDEYYGDFHDFGSHQVPAKDVNDYTLFVGNDPTTVTIGSDNPVEIVYFGYVKTSDMVAGDVTAKYVDVDGNELVPPEVFSGTIGSAYETERKEIEGYEFVRVDGDPKGTFTKDPQTVTYVYQKKLGSITVIKEDENGEKLSGAEFKLEDKDGNTVDIKTTGASGTVEFKELDWGTYTLTETKAPEGYRLLVKEIEIEIKQDNLHVTQTVENSLQDWEIPKTGGTGTLGFYLTGLLLMMGAAWFVIRRRIA